MNDTMKKIAPKKKPARGAYTQFLFCLGIVNITFIFLLFALAILGFAVRIAISPYHVIAALILTALAAIFLSWYDYGQKRSVNPKIAVYLMAAFMAILLSCGAIAHGIYDISYDGQWYHLGAVEQLVHGYNPLYGQVPDSYSGALFINDYPKTLEISSAVIVAFTHHIEDGKLLNMFLMVTAFLLIFPAIAYAFPKVDVKYALVIAALCALNPVSIYQSLSYYVDGASASLLAVIVFLSILAFKKMDAILYAALTFAIILTINYKFFDLAYVGIIVIGFVGLCHFYRRATRLHYLLVGSLVLGVLFGANPYITNTVNHGTPFYPVEGISTAMITGDTPPNLIGLNPVEKLLYSVFSESSVQKVDARLKIPLWINESEYMAFSQTDARVGGFGEWSGAIFLVTVIVAVLLVYVNFKDNDLLINFILLMGLLVLISGLINPASWWARYVPQLWLIPLLLLLGSCQRFKGKLKLLNYALIGLLVVNVLIVGGTYYTYQPKATGLIHDQFDQIKQYSPKNPVKLDTGMFPTTEVRFKEYGINYVLVENLTDQNRDRKSVV